MWTADAAAPVGPNENDFRDSHVLAVQPGGSNVCLLSVVGSPPDNLEYTSTVACFDADGEVVLGDTEGPGTTVYTGIALASNTDLFLGFGTLTVDGTVGSQQILRVGTPF